MSYPTTASYNGQGLSWKPLDFEGADLVTARLEALYQKWEGTPYMPGQRMPQIGVDCVRFVCAVMDEMYGIYTEIPREIQDRSLHDPKGAEDIVALIRSYYPDHIDLVIGDRCVEPGDIPITGNAQGGPGHAILVGTARNTMWQATTRAVRMTGLGLLDHYQQICTIVRPDKTLWLPAN